MTYNFDSLKYGFTQSFREGIFGYFVFEGILIIYVLRRIGSYPHKNDILGALKS